MPHTTCTCGAILEYANSQAGSKVRCSRCDALVETPAASATANSIADTASQAIQAGEPASSLRPFPGEVNPAPVRQGSGMVRLRKAIAGVVIAIGVLAIGLLLAPWVSAIREKAADTQDMINLKRLSLGLHTYQDVHKKLPSAYSLPRQPRTDDAEHSLFVQLLPSIEQDRDKEAISKRPDRFPKSAKQRGDVSFSPFLSAYDKATNPIGRINYAGNIRIFSDVGAKTDAGATVPLNGAMENSLALFRIQDGTSNTLAFATRFGECGTQSVPTLFDGLRPHEPGSPFFGAGTHSMPATDAAADDLTFQLMPSSANCRPTASVYGHAFRRNGLTIGMCDGTARVISPNIAVRLFQGVICPNDGVPEIDWSH
jgi:hypothetical protein